MKKIITYISAFAITFTSAVYPVCASVTLAEETAEDAVFYQEKQNKTNEPGTAELEKIIKIVKPKLSVPEECTEFSWNYNAPNYTREASWRMTWYDKAGNKEVNVSCDPNGNITSYSLYDYSVPSRGIALPEFTKEELAKTAFSFLEKLCPGEATKMKLVSSRASSLYSRNFIYTFARYENGVIVPDNTVSVSVNYVTGVPVSLNLVFDRDVTFEYTENINIEQAKEKLLNEQKMNLSYRLKNEYKDGKIAERKAYLIYTPEKSYLSVDANTGEVYTQRDSWTVANKSEPGTGSSNGLFGDMVESEDSAAEMEYQLSAEELEQLSVLENLISRQQAIDAVLKNEYLYIDPSATAVEAQLVKKNGYTYRSIETNYDESNNEYQWNIYFSAPYYESKKENGYFNPYMNAVVDAKDGTIISYSANVPGYGYFATDVTKIPENKYTQEQAQNIFCEFAKALIPEKLANTRVSSVSDAVVINYTEPDKDGNTFAMFRSSNINCVRVNEGIDFTYNNISGSVDRVTGKVTRFSYTWYDDVIFESPADAITPEQAYKVLLDSDGFGLNYEINSNYTYNQYLAEKENGYIDSDELYDAQKYTRLVYSGYDYLSTTVSAIEGNIINYSGNTVKREKDIVYSDIADHWAKDDIQKLSDLGIGFDGTEFAPDSEITLTEYMYLLNSFGKYLQKMSFEDEQADMPITRTQAVKYIIDSAGYYKIATLPDIFITDFADNSELKRADTGFIAIARGLGLVEGSANMFRPYDNITRAEAVTLIFKLVKLSD